MLSTTTYAVKATTAIPNPGNILRSMTRLVKTGLFLHASALAHGSLNKGRLDILPKDNALVNTGALRETTKYCTSRRRIELGEEHWLGQIGPRM